MKITNIHGKVLFSSRHKTIKATLEAAVKKEANLEGANLRGANLERVNIDFSCWPLWCGTKNVRVDIKIIRQLLAHVCCLDNTSKEYKEIKKLILPFAKKSHRAEELNLKKKKIQNI